MTQLNARKSSHWLITDAEVEVGDTVTFDCQTFDVVDIQVLPSRRWGANNHTTRLTLQGTCQVPGCRGRYTFEATKSRINPLRTCHAHRKAGGRIKPGKRATSPPAAEPKRPASTPQKPTRRTVSSFKVGEVVYHPRSGFGDVEETRNPYRHVIRVRFDGGKVDWVAPAQLTKIDPGHFGADQ